MIHCSRRAEEALPTLVHRSRLKHDRERGGPGFPVRVRLRRRLPPGQSQGHLRGGYQGPVPFPDVRDRRQERLRILKGSLIGRERLPVQTKAARQGPPSLFALQERRLPGSPACWEVLSAGERRLPGSAACQKEPLPGNVALSPKKTVPHLLGIGQNVQKTGEEIVGLSIELPGQIR